jgi:hypothetical protein
VIHEVEEKDYYDVIIKGSKDLIEKPICRANAVRGKIIS